MAKDDAPQGRRMGPAGSANWHAMLDGAEQILREEGYGALTSRRVAERIGVKQRLVYYYFSTMDALIAATFHRLAAREMERLLTAKASARPLHEIWDVCIHTGDARMIAEFMALANRVPDLKAEVIAYIEESRRIQVELLEAAMARNPAASSTIAPVGLAVLATSAALALMREAELGISTGHTEVMAAIGTFLDRTEAG